MYYLLNLFQKSNGFFCMKRILVRGFLVNQAIEHTFKRAHSVFHTDEKA